jgi:hypothetical protein
LHAVVAKARKAGLAQSLPQPLADLFRQLLMRTAAEDDDFSH